MRLLTAKETKNILLSGILGFSLFLSGCSSDLKILTQVSQQVSNVQDTSTEESSSGSKVLSYDELIKALKSGKAPDYVLKATVDRVIDGDTVKLKFEDGTNESLRILLIDTPEDTKEKQYLGDVATSFAKKKS